MINKKFNKIESFTSIFTISVLIYLLLIKNLFYYYRNFLDINNSIYFVIFFLLVLIWIILILLSFRKKLVFNEIGSKINIPIFLFFLMSFITFLYIFFDPPSQAAIIYQLKVLFYAFINLGIGYFILQASAGKYVKYTFYLSFFIFLLFLFLSPMLWNGYWPPGSNRIHVGDSFSLLGIFFVSILNNKYLKIISVTFIIFLLFFIQSRASFFSFGVIALLIMFKELGLKGTLLTGTFLLLISILFFYDTQIINRMLVDVLLGNDTSMNQRNQLLFEGIKSIKEHWFLGDFAGQYSNNIESGQYIHNILSLWRQYGVIFFVLFIVLFYLTLYRISTKWYCTKDFRIDMTFYLSLFTGIELLLFRSYGTTHYWIGLGMMYSYLYSHYNNDKSS